jgi:branched-subunit amino acid permease
MATLATLIPILTFMAIATLVLVGLSLVQRRQWIDEAGATFAVVLASILLLIIAVISAEHNMLLYTWLSMLTLAAVLLACCLMLPNET